jgi:hypothetical protein
MRRSGPRSLPPAIIVLMVITLLCDGVTVFLRVDDKRW